MLPINNGVLPADKRQLLRLYDRLSADDRHALVAFAEFMIQRQADGPASANQGRQDDARGEPLDIPRPEEESVIGAIKRLSRSYHMVDRSRILTETSSLMTGHLVHGRKAEHVIDELEALFRKAYADQFNDE